MSNPRIPYRLGSTQAELPSLRGKRLIVQFIVNVEAWLFNSKMPRTIVTPPQGIDQIPDIPNFCWAEYGMRLGMKRLIDEFSSRGIPVGASINAGVIDIYPECAEAIRAAGWEFIGHGLYQKAIQGEADEPGLIRAVLDKIEAFTGARPRGWLGPGLRQSLATADHLAANGIEYTFDWNVDDVPCEMTTSSGRLFAMPYTQDLNDSIIYAIERHATGEFYNRIARTLAAYEAEPGPHVISMGLHPHLMGVPHRLHEMREILDLFQSHSDVVFATPAETMDWYKAATQPQALAFAQ
jgi:peptidoglycan/xylan/chitin deacetylase (PgdA/CDA1 family)